MKTIDQIVTEFEGMADTYLNRHAKIPVAAKFHVKGNLSVWLRDMLEHYREELMLEFIQNTYHAKKVK